VADNPAAWISRQPGLLEIVYAGAASERSSPLIEYLEAKPSGWVMQMPLNTL